MRCGRIYEAAARSKSAALSALYAASIIVFKAISLKYIGGGCPADSDGRKAESLGEPRRNQEIIYLIIIRRKKWLKSDLREWELTRSPSTEW